MIKYRFTRENGEVEKGSYSEREYRSLLACEHSGAVTTHSRSGVVGLVFAEGCERGCLVDGNEYIIFTHFVQTMDFVSMISMQRDQEFLRVKSYVYSFVQALARLHTIGRVHGDIKADNFLYEGHRVGLGSLCDMTFSDVEDSSFLKYYATKMGIKATPLPLSVCLVRLVSYCQLSDWSSGPLCPHSALMVRFVRVSLPSTAFMLVRFVSLSSRALS